MFHSFVLTYDAAQVTPQSGHRVGAISCWWPHHHITITPHQITSHHHHITSHESAWLKPSHHVAEDDDDDDDEHLFLLCLHVIPHVNQSLCCHTREKFFHTSPCFVARRRVRTLKVDQPTQSTQAENKERTPNR